MFAVTGITGQVGGQVARNLLAAKIPVRAVVRDASKGAEWKERGCAVVSADIHDATALTAAFRNAGAVFVMVPPSFDPSPDFREAQAIGGILRTAIDAARPGRVVYLSTIGAQAKKPNLLTQHGIIERALWETPVPITFFRPGWFMENASWDVASAMESGVIPSFLQPLDRALPMVATADIGRVAAELMRETWEGRRVVELEGPRRITPNQIAGAFSDLLGRPVKMEIVQRESWESLFRSQGMKNPTPRAQMLDGFNEGWIEFEGGEAGSRKGNVEIKEVLRGLIAGAARP
jgi:NAD(P)H dehydrogenase (quinone)